MATEELGSMLDFFLLTHRRSFMAEILVERMPLIAKMPAACTLHSPSSSPVFSSAQISSPMPRLQTRRQPCD